MRVYIREYDHFYSDCPKRMIGGGIHPYYEVLFISAGAFQLHWNGNAYKAEAPALFVFTPSSPHHIEQISPLLSCSYVEFRLQESEYIPNIDVIHAWNIAQTRQLLNQDGLDDITATLAAICESIEDNKPRKFGETFYRIMACDIQKLLLQVDYYVSPTISHKHLQPTTLLHDKWSAQSYIYDLIRHMEDNYMQDITLDDLAKKSGYTPSYIIRLFKEMTDLTPLQYLYELRMNAATSYLQSTRMSVQDIAESIGFPNIHYFSRMFKKKFGESPTEWKRTHTV